MFIAVILVVISNDRDTLTQKMWRAFFKHTLEALDSYGRLENVWISDSVSAHQNASFKAQFTNKKQMEICKNYLSEVALRYEQESITWIPMRDAEYLAPKKSHVRELPLPKALDKVIP